MNGEKPRAMFECVAQAGCAYSQHACMVICADVCRKEGKEGEKAMARGRGGQPPVWEGLGEGGPSRGAGG